MTIRPLVGLAAVLLLAGTASSAAADGAAVYKEQCAKCHGDTGHADTAVGKAMKVKPLAGDANVQKMAEADVVALVKANAKHPPAVKGLGDDDLNAVAKTVKELAAGK